MDLWIRSQDRRNLIKTERLYVSGKNDEYYIGDSLIGHIGIYKTEERALEILDEIENFIYTEVNIVNSLYEEADIEVKSKILCNMAKIFEMPEE